VSPERLRRRYVVLSALRFLPTGLLIPVTAVFMQSRGLSLAQIGVAVATQSVVVIVLELPTGGLADALGRRPVLLLATVIDLVAMVLFVTADGPRMFALAWAVEGVYRALESGPLDAWYVDSALEADRDADLERGLAASSTSLALAIAAGGLAAAGLAALPPVGGIDPLALPILAAIALRVVDLAAIAALVTEPRRARGPRAAWGASKAAPEVVRRTLRLLASSSALLALVAVELLWGAGLTGVELLSGPRLADLLGAERGVTTFGVTVAAGWLLSAAGSASTARITALAGSPARAGVALRLAQGGAALVMAVVAGPIGLVTGYLAFYVVHGPANVVHYSMVHRLTTAEHRTTMVSANSLAGRLGGAGAAIGLGALATSAGIPAAWLVAAALLAGGAPLYRVAGRTRPVLVGEEARS
jgi:MFS transporter, DHA1 family, tetracycline resistance protein